MNESQRTPRRHYHEFSRTCIPLLGLLIATRFAPTPLSAAESPPVNLEAIEMVPRLKINGTVGSLFRIEYTDQLSQSGEWETLKYIVLPNSSYEFLDTTVAGNTKRFYRVMWGPRPPQLVWIQPGSYAMGSPGSEQDRFPDEGPQSVVAISNGFWIGKYEVTQAEYLSITGINPSTFSDDLKRPVETVSWNDAHTYCVKLTEEERKAGRLPAGYAYRLPTEAEWEFAARAGTHTRFSFGDDPTYGLLTSYVWYGSNSADTTHLVGTKLPNPWGLHDMHGNVWEWCSDWYGESYSIGGGLLGLLDPLGPLLGSTRVIRGGSWKGLNRFCRSASRSSSNPLIPGPNVGFRVVLALARP